LDGDFAYERDSVGFKQADYNWPLLSCLLHIAACNQGTLRVVDFGGSLGSTFLQHRVFLRELNAVDWRVVEQESFVRFGKSVVSVHPAGAGLSFYSDVDSALEPGGVDVLLLGSVLQYLEDPLRELQGMLNRNFPYVLLDRTAVLRGDGQCLLTVQQVPAAIYDARYPAWFISYDRLRRQFGNDYQCLSEWGCSDSYVVTRGQSDFIGCFFRKVAEEPL
jgi:putative methyltransferase (TIGR04325 family)